MDTINTQIVSTIPMVCLTTIACAYHGFVGNTEFRKQYLRFINQVIPILIYHFVRDLLTCLPSGEITVLEK